MEQLQTITKREIRITYFLIRNLEDTLTSRFIKGHILIVYWHQFVPNINKNFSSTVSHFFYYKPMLNGTIYQAPILTMENMIAGIVGSPGSAVLMRPQP